MLYIRIFADRTSQKGAGMAEYALLLVLIAVVAAVGFGALGSEIDTLADTVTTKLKG